MESSLAAGAGQGVQNQVLEHTRCLPDATKAILPGRTLGLGPAVARSYGLAMWPRYSSVAAWDSSQPSRLKRSKTWLAARSKSAYKGLSLSGA
jgi:hypothetical protein